MPPEPSVDTGKLLEWRFKNGLSYDHIAALAGLAVGTIHQRLRRFEFLFEEGQGADHFQARESGVLAGIRTRLLAHIAEGLSAENAHEKVSPYQAVGMYGILFDKQRILDGKSTANIAVLSRIIDNGQESGDSALRKLTLDSDADRKPQSEVSHNSYTTTVESEDNK